MTTPTTTQTAILTALEQTVLDAMTKQANDCSGGDFGIMGEVDFKALGMTGQQFGGVVTSLQTKGRVTVHEPVKVNGDYWVTQFTIEPVAVAGPAADLVETFTREVALQNAAYVATLDRIAVLVDEARRYNGSQGTLAGRNIAVAAVELSEIAARREAAEHAVAGGSGIRRMATRCTGLS